MSTNELELGLLSEGFKANAAAIQALLDGQHDQAAKFEAGAYEDAVTAVATPQSRPAYFPINRAF